MSGQQPRTLTYGSHPSAFSVPGLPALVPGLCWKVDAQGTTFISPSESFVGTISGTITYGGNYPIAKIKVNIFSQNSDLPAATATIVTAVGSHIIADLPAMAILLTPLPR
jgi:hypothetical protein